MDELPIWAVNLQEILSERKLQQSEVADAAKLKRDAFNRYVNGRTKPPAKKLIAIAAVLKVKPSDIDPESTALDDVKPEIENVEDFTYQMTPGLSGRRGYLQLKMNVELPAGLAVRIVEQVEMETGAGVDRPIPEFLIEDD